MQLLRDADNLRTKLCFRWSTKQLFWIKVALSYNSISRFSYYFELEHRHVKIMTHDITIATTSDDKLQ